MSRSTTIDLLANIVSRLAAGGLQFVFVPVYVALLGPDGYGLLGLYLATLGLLLCIDQAITPMITRTFAKHHGDASMSGHMWDTLRTAELISVAVGCLFGLVLFAAAPWVAANVVHSEAMSVQTREEALRAMSLTLACQWPSFAYSGALTGLRRQVSLNSVRTGVSVVQWLGGALLLSYARVDVAWLFIWQAGCFLVQAILLRRHVTKGMPRPPRTPRFSSLVVAQSWRYSTGAVIIGVTGAVLTQGDKFFISHFTTLANFSAYSLAFLMASLIGIFVAQPIATVAFPSFVKALHTKDDAALARQYHAWTQATVLLIAPTSAALMVFPEAILTVWMHKSPQIVDEISGLLPWIAAGTLMNLIMLLPFTLQMAAGWTSLSSIKNIIILPFFIGGLWYFVPHVGPLAGAIAWLFVNATYYFIEIPIMHRRLLSRHMFTWWSFDTLLPCVCAVALTAAIRHWGLLLAPETPAIVLCVIGWLTATLALAGVLKSSRDVLGMLRQKIASRASISGGIA